jgi:hypothetical protein
MDLPSNFDNILTGIAPEKPILKFQINNITLTNVDNTPGVVASLTLVWFKRLFVMHRVDSY